MRQQHSKRRTFNKTRYFDEWEYKQALSLILVNPIEAEKKYKEYLEKCPLDCCAYGDYAYVLIILHKFEEAEIILERAKELFERESFFNSDPVDGKKLKDRLLFDTLKLWSYQGRYEELYNYCVANAKKIDELELQSLAFYSKIKSGRQPGKPREDYNYRSRQIIEYREEEFLDHVKKHLADYNIEADNYDVAMFTPNFPFDKVFAEVKKYIPSDKGLCIGACDNKYIFRYDGCGRVKNKLVNYFKVVCLHDSSDFITMYPTDEAEALPYIDLNYLVTERQDTKVRRLSQIDKFKQRYNKNN